MYLKKRDSKAVINNDSEGLSNILAARARSKEFKQLKMEMSSLRKELDQLKIIILEFKDRNG